MEKTQFFPLCITLLLCVAEAQTNLTTDQSALLTLKAKITSDPQNMLSNWSNKTSICNWVGVTCGRVHLRVSVLDLSYFGLTGGIPPQLGNLSFLVELRLRNNSFSGILPVELVGFRRLKLVSFKYNNFMGEIPLWFGSLSKLQILNLYGNGFTGSIPAAVFNLSGLKVLALSNNQLSGAIPSNIGLLENLVNLSLSYNNLEGTIPSSFGNLESLHHLDLSRNNLSGVIPKSLEELLHLKYLNLSFNRLHGEIPTGGSFKNLSAESFISNDGLCGSYQGFQPCRIPGQYSRSASSSVLIYILPAMFAGMLVVSFISSFIVPNEGLAEVRTEPTLMPDPLQKKVSYQEILSATNGFNETNLLGSGGFGSMYKGILSNGTEIAVKVFNSQLEEAFKSFDFECELLGNVSHQNLIKIISSCNQSHFKALVLDYMPNGSLERLLYSEEYCSLKILERLNIMIDVASALEYLHHGYSIPIVHCDLKPANILFDNDMVAHVADFGIARLLGGGDSVTKTMTLATVGYMAPEYGTDGIVTGRGDVYSFGMVLMETFTKKKPTDKMFVEEMSLKRWVSDSLLSDAVLEVVDASLLGTEEDHDFVNKRDCLSSIMRLALACSAKSPVERISMRDVAVTLHKIKNNYLKDTGGV